MNLFERGNFVLASGAQSSYKIECDALTDDDIETLAWMIAINLRLNFGSVEGVPTGGLRLAGAMQQYISDPESERILIVDDVWTSGGSMRNHRAGRYNTIGAVIFARGPVDPWVFSLFKFGWVA